jgi:Fe-S-cluster-containing hydrogenase component 2
MDYPCIASCPVQALSKDANTAAVIADRAKWHQRGLH